MKCMVVLLAVLGLCQAKPRASFTEGARPGFFFSGDQYIVGGSDASPGEFPWQLSQTRGGSHSCGATLLNSRYGLSASHCVDGALVGSITVIAGLHQRSGTPGSQEVDLSSYTMHENYNEGTPAFANDIAILTFASQINIGGNIQPATLPANNNNDFVGTTCVLSGWGRTGSSNILPDTLQKVSIEVIGTTQCDNAMAGVIGANVWDNHLCFFDSAQNEGSCNGDSGGPANCPDGGSTVVAGVTSWGVSSGGNCLQSYPSVYTRVSAYLGWIANNTP